MLNQLISHHLKLFKGAQTEIDGDSYVGSWVDDLPHGWGAFYWNNGTSFEGGVSHGVPDGQASSWIKHINVAVSPWPKRRS